MAVTITDIAQRAGVSRSMVSRALTGNGPVKAKKKEEIIALAQAMGIYAQSGSASFETLEIPYYWPVFFQYQCSDLSICAAQCSDRSLWSDWGALSDCGKGN